MTVHLSHHRALEYMRSEAKALAIAEVLCDPADATILLATAEMVETLQGCEIDLEDFSTAELQSIIQSYDLASS